MGRCLIHVLADLPAVIADPARAVQILANLLVNALRYTTTPGRIEVAVSREEATVAFQISDTGIGLTPEQPPHLFERFYRVDASRSRAFGGSGIGLTIAQSLAQAMQGDISVASAGLSQAVTSPSPFLKLIRDRFLRMRFLDRILMKTRICA